MTINEQIHEKLKSGAEVYSYALGRVGKVVAVDDHPLFPVQLEVQKKIYATTFDQGDPVKLHYSVNSGRWEIVHTT